MKPIIVVLSISFAITCAITAAVLQNKLDNVNDELTRLELALDKTEQDKADEYNQGRADVKYDMALGACLPFADKGEWAQHDCRVRIRITMNNLETKGANSR